MLNMVSIIRTIILLGSVQGFVMGGILLFRAKQDRPMKWLAWLLFLMSTTSLYLLVINNEFLNTNVVTRVFRDFIPLTIVMPVGPLILFYTKSSLSPQCGISKKEKRFFWLVLFDFGKTIIAAIFFLLASMKLIQPNPVPWGYAIDVYNMYVDVPRWLSLSFFLYASYRHLQTNSLYDESAANRKQALILFVKVFAVFQCFWLIQLVPYIAGGFEMRIFEISDWYLVYVPMAILIYWLGINGLILSYRPGPLEKKNSNLTIATISAETIASVQQQLQDAMEHEKLFLDPDLDLPTLVKKIGIPARTISAVLNQHLHKSFNEFVNGYRIMEIKKRMKEEASRQLTISAIAQECGFNSQATFQRAFKHHTGLTPSQFLHHIKNSSVKESE